MLEEVANKERVLMRQKSRKALLASRKKYQYENYKLKQHVWRLKQELKTNHLKHNKKTKLRLEKEALKHKEKVNEHIKKNRDLRVERDRLLKKLQHFGSRKSVVYRTKTVKAPVPYEVKKLLKLKDTHEGFFNPKKIEKFDLIEILAKADILLKDNNIGLPEVVVLLNLEIFKDTGLSKQQLYSDNFRVISKLVKSELMSKSNYNLFFITPKGINLVEELRRKIKSSKSVILNKNVDGHKG